MRASRARSSSAPPAESFAGPRVQSRRGRGPAPDPLQIPQCRSSRACDRALKQRLLSDNDPLAARRAETIVGEELGRGPLARRRRLALRSRWSAAAFRLSPFVVDTGAAAWQGAVAYDLQVADLRRPGHLRGKDCPEGLDRIRPSIGSQLARSADRAGPGDRSGILGQRLGRRSFSSANSRRSKPSRRTNERLRRQQRRDLDRQREKDRQAAEEAARQAKMREDQARLRSDGDRTAHRGRAPQAEPAARQRRSTTEPHINPGAPAADRASGRRPGQPGPAGRA